MPACMFVTETVFCQVGLVLFISSVCKLTLLVLLLFFPVVGLILQCSCLTDHWLVPSMIPEYNSELLFVDYPYIH